MDENNTIPWLSPVVFWLGGAIVSVGGIVLGSKVIDGILSRREERRKRLADVHDTNQTAKITAETKLTDSLIDRIAKLEKQVQELNDKWADTKAENAKLLEQNKTLLEQNKMLIAENKERREAMHKLRNELVARDLKILNLEHDVADLKKEVHPEGK